MGQRYQHFIFDLDGTLVDTAADLTAAMNHVMQTVDAPAIPVDAVRNMVGMGARALIRAGLERTFGPQDEDAIEKHVPTFLAYYAENIAVHSHAYPGVTDTLTTLKARDCHITLCTNKPAALAEDLLTRLKLSDYFSHRFGGDSLTRAKPHAEPLLELVRRTGTTAETSLMVGDSITDAKAARAAGMHVALVDYGFSVHPIADLKPDHHLNKITQLLDL